MKLGRVFCDPHSGAVTCNASPPGLGLSPDTRAKLTTRRKSKNTVSPRQIEMLHFCYRWLYLRCDHSEFRCLSVWVLAVEAQGSVREPLNRKHGQVKKAAGDKQELLLYVYIAMLPNQMRALAHGSYAHSTQTIYHQPCPILHANPLQCSCLPCSSKHRG